MLLSNSKTTVTDSANRLINTRPVIPRNIGGLSGLKKMQFGSYWSWAKFNELGARVFTTFPVLTHFRQNKTWRGLGHERDVVRLLYTQNVTSRVIISFILKTTQF